jgi:hypothetical protein
LLNRLSRRSWDGQLSFGGGGEAVTRKLEKPAMSTQDKVEKYITQQSEPKRSEMQNLHQSILRISPGCKLWFLDGKNGEGKVISNPNIGYGLQTMEYVDGKRRDFYQVGLSANTTGISVYIMGVDDKKYLNMTYGGKIGKAKISGYCIRFKRLEDISMDVLEEAIRFGLNAGEN